MIVLFRIEDVNSAPALFDVKKLTHVNGEWIRRIDTADFVERATDFVVGEDERAALVALAHLAQERVKVLDELPEYFDWVHGPAEDSKSWDKAMKLPAAGEVLDAIIEAYTDAPWERDELHARFIALAERFGINASKVQGPIRVAVTGRIVGLPLFDLLAYLGRDETLRRLQRGRERLV
jgi:glutamyl-tRNA synthetase